jgi:hypothetical protein
MTQPTLVIHHKWGCSEPPREDRYCVSVETGRGYVEAYCPSCLAVGKLVPSWRVVGPPGGSAT